MYLNTENISIDYKSNLTYYLQDYVYYNNVQVSDLVGNVFNLFPTTDTTFFESDNIFYLSSYSFMLIPPPTSFIFCVVLALDDLSDANNINIKVNNDYLKGLLNTSETTVTYETQLHPSQDYVVEFEFKDINFAFVSTYCGVSISFK